MTLYIAKLALLLLPHKELNSVDEYDNNNEENKHINPHDIKEWNVTFVTLFLLLPISRLYYFLGDKAISLKEVCFLSLFVFFFFSSKN
jgi:hypothetical protein